MAGMAWGGHHGFRAGIGWTVLMKVGGVPALCAMKGTTGRGMATKSCNVRGDLSKD